MMETIPLPHDHPVWIMNFVKISSSYYTKTTVSLKQAPILPLDSVPNCGHGTDSETKTVWGEGQS